MSLLTVNHLAVAFQDRRVVDDISLQIDAGETLALVGESGSGKVSPRYRSCVCCRSHPLFIRKARSSLTDKIFCRLANAQCVVYVATKWR
jgi:ABC-type microcin C transport system duplicated ATPase subunit YejF